MVIRANGPDRRVFEDAKSGLGPTRAEFVVGIDECQQLAARRPRGVVPDLGHSPVWEVDHPGARGSGDVGRSIGRAVVGDDDLDRRNRLAGQN